MNIVFLDAFTLRPEEIDLEPLHALGSLTMYDRSSRSEVLERAQNAEIVLTNKTVIDAEIMDQLPKLKYIGVTATGYNIVDVAAARDRGITVTNAKNYSSMSVAQQVFALIMQFSNRVSEHNSLEKWSKVPDFCYYDYTLTELAGKTLGLVGIGDIGEKVAQVAKAFEMKVIVHRKSATPHPNYETVTLDDLLSRSDYVSLHCPLTDKNKGFMGTDSFEKMKSSAILINTARGPLINENELVNALNQGKIAGAALDVLSQEPADPNSPLFGAKNLVISPHVAWATLEARQRLMKIVTENIEAFIAGKSLNVLG
ncbi:glycerate dehydrogenase [Spirosomataceae bacterium TFI 002]|nr:glycerate dehydrogenase [Spirosomataceae bacterium TFI 002]